MTGGLYHSGGVPLHAIRLEVDGVGDEEVGVLLGALAGLSCDDEPMVRVGLRLSGFRARIEGAFREDQALRLVEGLYSARRVRGGSE